MLNASLAGVQFSTHPCKCGNFGDPKRECHCTPRQVMQYRDKISGPLLDRIDIHIEVPSIAYKELATKIEGTSSATIRKDVIKARQIQAKRFKDEKIFTNAQMNTRQIKKYCKIDEACENLLKQAIDELGLSARAHSRILNIIRTDISKPRQFPSSSKLKGYNYQKIAA